MENKSEIIIKSLKSLGSLIKNKFPVLSDFSFDELIDEVAGVKGSAELGVKDLDITNIVKNTEDLQKIVNDKELMAEVTSKEELLLLVDLQLGEIREAIEMSVKTTESSAHLKNWWEKMSEELKKQDNTIDDLKRKIKLLINSLRVRYGGNERSSK